MGKRILGALTAIVTITAVMAIGASMQSHADDNDRVKRKTEKNTRTLKQTREIVDGLVDIQRLKAATAAAVKADRRERAAAAGARPADDPAVPE